MFANTTTTNAEKKEPLFAKHDPVSDNKKEHDPVSSDNKKDPAEENVEKDERDTGSKCRARKCCSDMACAQKAKCAAMIVLAAPLIIVLAPFCLARRAIYGPCECKCKRRCGGTGSATDEEVSKAETEAKAPAEEEKRDRA